MKLTASPKVLISVFVLMFLTILLSSQYLAGLRFDLTQSKLYTLSDGTKRILDNLDKPVTLTLYFSDKASSQLPALRTYAQRVEELLEEYVGLSDGKLQFNNRAMQITLFCQSRNGKIISANSLKHSTFEINTRCLHSIKRSNR